MVRLNTNDSMPEVTNDNIAAYCIWSPVVTITGIFLNFFSILVLKTIRKEQMYYLQLVIMSVEILISFGKLLKGVCYHSCLHQQLVVCSWVKYNYTLATYVCGQIVMNNMPVNLCFC